MPRSHDATLEEDDAFNSVLQERSPLISAERLMNLLDHPRVRLFDVRGTWKTPARALPEEFAAGHIPGAVFLDWTRHFIEQGVPIGLASIADENEAQDSFRKLGINDGDLVVLYDDYSHMQAGRIWIAMRAWGFERVRVLNGGWRNWVNGGMPVSLGTAEFAEGSFEPLPVRNLVMDLETFLVSHETSCLIDARGPINYAGDVKDPRTGHIPGALNVPFSALLDADSGLFLENAAIAGVLDEAAPRWRTDPIIASCGSGYAATVLLLALEELGAPAQLFDGSFSLWKQDKNRPVEQSSRT